MATAIEKVSVSDAIADALVTAGVTHVFGGHGATVVPLINAIVRHPKLTWVYMRNETNASLAAAAYAKLTGNLGVCVATSGPGATYLVTGLIDGDLDKVPMLALTGLKSTHSVGSGSFQDIRQAQLIAAGGLGWSKACMSDNSVMPMLKSAMHYAADKQAATHLAIPVDVLSSRTLPDSNVPRLKTLAERTEENERPLVVDRSPFDLSSLKLEVSHAKVEQAAELLSDPRTRTVICLGHRAAIACCGEEVLSLAETLNAPVVTLLDGKGTVDETHPLSAGVIEIFGNPGLEASRALVVSADVAILIGVDRADDVVQDASGNQARAVIMFDYFPRSPAVTLYSLQMLCLDSNLSRLVSKVRIEIEKVREKKRIPSDVVRAKEGKAAKGSSRGKIWDFFQEGRWRQAVARSSSPTGRKSFCIGSIGSNLSGMADGANGGQRKATVTQRRVACFEVDLPETAPEYIHPAEALAILSTKLREGDVVVVDIGDVTLWSALALVLRPGVRVLSSLSMGTMGYAVPGAIAAALARPDNQVFALAGDGGLQMSSNELATAVQMGCSNLRCLILRNSVLGRVYFGFEGAGGTDVGCPDLLLMAQSLHGGKGGRTQTVEEAETVISDACAHKGVYIIDAVTDPELKAEMAKMKPTVSIFEQLADILPSASALSPADLELLAAFDVSGTGHLSIEQLRVAREVLLEFDKDKDSRLTEEEKLEVLNRLRNGQLLPIASSVRPLTEPELSDLEVTRLADGDPSTPVPGSCLRYIGDIKDVLSGTPDPKLLEDEFDASRFVAGFELGTFPKSLQSLGELLVIGGYAYWRPTDQNDQDTYYVTQKGPKFRSVSFVGVERPLSGGEPDFLARFSAFDSPMQWSRILNDVYMQVKAPFFFHGIAELAVAEATAIALAPVRGESLQANPKKYYTQAELHTRNLCMAVVGLVSANTLVEDPVLRGQLETQLYSGGVGSKSDAASAQKAEKKRTAELIRKLSSGENCEGRPGAAHEEIHNRLEQASKALQTHTHAVSLKRLVGEDEDVKPPMVNGVFHLHASSLASAIFLKIHVISSAKQLP